MDDLPLQKILISGPTIASLLQRFSSASGDIDGLLFGNITVLTPSNLSDDNPAAPNAPPSSSSSDSLNLVATITSFISSHSTSSFYSPSGCLNLTSLNRFISSSSSSSLIGWFSGRRKTQLRPSMRESSVTSSLASAVHLSFPVLNSPQSYTFSPCIFLLLTTPFQDQLIHTHEYRAYQFRLSNDHLVPKTLDVVNIGPAFRGHYGAFCPNSPFPLLHCEFRGSSSAAMVEDGNSENDSLKSQTRASDDQKKLDMCADGFDIGRLSWLMGPENNNYTGELENLYNKMLTKLEGLARQVEMSSATVLEQENHNMKLRYKVAGLE